MAYTKAIAAPTCLCGARAKLAVYNRYNAHVGDYCTRCAKSVVKTLESEVKTLEKGET